MSKKKKYIVMIGSEEIVFPNRALRSQFLKLINESAGDVKIEIYERSGEK